MIKAVRKSAENPTLALARKVLQIESEAVHALIERLDERFLAAVDLIHHRGGRVVVSGIGKSGHIARKIASTMASTGTPAYFVHPAEASHGDLGMIQSGDAILALSWSGETVELADMITYSRRFGIPLVAITANADADSVRDDGTAQQTTDAAR